MKKLFNFENKGKLAFACLPLGFLAKQNTFETIITIVGSFFADVLTPLLQLITALAMTIAKWALTLIDFCFVLIRQLGGLNTDFSSFESIAESDIIFKFIFDENIVNILKTLIGLAIVVIIVLGIIAIIKSEFTAVADTSDKGEIKNDKWPIWKRIFESVFLLILVPVVFIGGMIFSNAILQTLMNAASGGSNMTMGSQIFVTSTYSANAYRIYADKNKKIPITYQFNQIKDYSAVTEWDESGTVAKIAEAMEQYKQAEEWDQGYATFEMFYLNAFFDMDDIDYIQHTAPDGENPYSVAYDKGIKTYRYEYYVNADVQDYLMRYGTEVCIVSVEKAVETCRAAGIELNINADYSFEVKYTDNEAESIKYKHKAGAKDEADGAVYLICLEKANESGKVYYEPLTQQNSHFSTYYLQDKNQYVVARGFFEEGIYPTAIRERDGKIEFYRERLNVPTLGTLFPHISYELPEGSTEEAVTHVLKSAVQMFTGVDVSEFIPYIYFDIDLMCLFTKNTVVITSLQAGQYYLDYGFTSPNMDIGFVYNKLSIDYFVLAVAIALIFGRVVKAFFGLLKRSVDIMFLYLVYPAAIATMPLYEKSSFGKWVKNMTGKVMSLYGLMIGINLALLLIPICNTIDLFVPQDIQNTIFGFMSNTSAFLLNNIFKLLFTLVGISFIFDVPKIVQDFVGTGSADIIDDGAKVMKGVYGVYESAASVISGQALVSAVKDVTGYKDPKTGQYHAGWLPFSAGIQAIDNVKQRKKTKENTEKRNQQKTQQTEDRKNELIKQAQARRTGTPPVSTATTPPSGTGTSAPGGGTTPPPSGGMGTSTGSGTP